MKIFLNEEYLNCEPCVMSEIVKKYKIDCDLKIVNGYIVNDNYKIKENDKIILIKKGIMPSLNELEHLMMARHSPEVFEKLKNGKVGIIGLGGLGSNIAISLVRMGVGQLKLLDYDVVEPSNLNRQQYYFKQIGKLKTEAMKEILENINPFTKIQMVNEYLKEGRIKDIFDDVNILIEAVDNPKTKAIIVNECLSTMENIKIISSSGMAGYYSSNSIITKKINSRFYICGDLENEAKLGCGLMAPRVSICANHQANMAVRLLLGIDEV